MHGRISAPKTGALPSWKNRILSVLVSMVLACSLVPCTAFAETPAAADTPTTAETTRPVLTDELQTTTIGKDAPDEDTEAANAPSPTDGAVTDSIAAVTAPAPITSATGDGTTDKPTPDASLPSAVVAPTQNAAQSAAVQTSSGLSASGFVMISRSANPTTTSALSGLLQQNETLYAIAWAAKNQRVRDDGSWQYEWLAGSGTKTTDFVPIEGQTGPSLQLTDELRAQLNGKYLRVRITAGDVSVEGPKVAASYKTLTACGPVKAPIPLKTELDAHSYVLLQPTQDASSTFDTTPAKGLKAGTTLWANVWDGEASPAKRLDSRDNLTYHWLASESQEATDNTYEPIDGQTGPSLTITEELATALAGKYIRVRVEGNGHTLFGPSSAFKTPASVSYNTPGPVIAPGQIKLDHVVLAFNGAPFGDDYETAADCHVGDTIEACAYDSDDPYTLYDGNDVIFSWQIADSAYGTYEEAATGASITVPQAWENKYLKVVATAQNGIPGSGSCASPSGKVLPEGIYTLYKVSILNKENKEIGTTLTAQAYDGDYWSQAPVCSHVTYTWFKASEKPGYYYDESIWTPLSGGADGSLTVTEELEGCWVMVSACAGDNTVVSPDSENAAGPFRKAGSHEIYTAGLVQTPENPADRFQFLTGSIVSISARDTSSAGTAGDYLTPDQMTYTWYCSDERWGEYTELPDENAHRASFIIPDSYAGKYLKCIVCAGFLSYETNPISKPIALGDPAQAYIVTSIALETSDGTGIPKVGATVTPHAMTELDGVQMPIPADGRVQYVWYSCDDAEGTNPRAVEGSLGTGALTIGSALQGKYLYVEATSGANTLRSAPVAVQKEEAPRTVTVQAHIVGAVARSEGTGLVRGDWIPASAFTFNDNVRTSAWDIFASLLDEAGYYYSTQGACPYSITTPGRSITLHQSASAPWSYWAFYINGRYADVLPSGYYPQNGDEIELIYIDATGKIKPSEDEETGDDEIAIEIDTEAPVADWDASWSGFGGSDGRSVTVSDELPRYFDTAWTYDFAQGASSSWSEPVIAGGFVFFARNNTLDMIDAATGAVCGAADLAGTVAYGSRPIYAGGMIIVALSDGRLQALSALTLQTKWLTPKLESFTMALHARMIAEAGLSDDDTVRYVQQSLSSLTVNGTDLYAATASADWQKTYDGYLVCIDLRTGEEKWTRHNASAGYYWAGAATLDGMICIAGDDGNLEAIPASSADGGSVASLSLGVPCRSTTVAHGGFIFVVTTDGVLHKVTLDSGRLTEVGSVSFATRSTSTPSFDGSIAYVGGADGAGGGILAVIDTDTMAVVQTVSTADGKAIPGEVKSRPLVVSDGSSQAVLFTANGAVGTWPNYTDGGGVYAFFPGCDEATEIYKPEDGKMNYSMGSVCYSDGLFYYVNDSGHLFALRACDKPTDNPEEEPTPSEEPNDTPSDIGPTSTNPVGWTGTGTARYTTLPGRVAPAVTPDETSASETPTAEAAISDDATPLATYDHTEPAATTGESASSVALWALVALSLMGVAVAAYLLATSRKRIPEKVPHE